MSPAGRGAAGHRASVLALLATLLACPGAAVERRRRLAICLYGKVGNLRGHSRKFASDGSLPRVVYQSHRRHLVEPNMRRGWDVLFFAHTPDAHLQEELQRLYRFRKASFAADSEPDNYILDGEKWRAIEGKLRAMGESMRRSVDLALSYRFPFDAMVLMRFDLMPFADFNIPEPEELGPNLWVPGWCEPRSLDSVRYGDAIGGRPCGRLHANELFYFGLPDYFFFGTPETIDSLADWGQSIDSVHGEFVYRAGPHEADGVLKMGAHAMIYAHARRMQMEVSWSTELVDDVNLLVARRTGCHLEVDWQAPVTNVGLACARRMLSGRCPEQHRTYDPVAKRVCPLEGRIACLGPHVRADGNCTWRRRLL